MQRGFLFTGICNSLQLQSGLAPPLKRGSRVYVALFPTAIKVEEQFTSALKICAH